MVNWLNARIEHEINNDPRILAAHGRQELRGGWSVQSFGLGLALGIDWWDRTASIDLQVGPFWLEARRCRR